MTARTTPPTPRPAPKAALRLYDTLTREKREFAPVDPRHVRLYVCGPTVYDLAHIGNARPLVVFDVLFRLLRHLYGRENVIYARNLTDVDDKINARAVERFPELPPNEAIRRLTEETTAQFHKDVAGLGCLPPTHEPRATDHIAEMRDIIERLLARGVAYVAEEHVLFHVPAMATLKGMPRYGALARRSLDEMVAGARVDVAPFKRDPMDFVLWKPSRAANEPGWASPGGIETPGRPGWHIECSAMAFAHLVRPFLGPHADDPAASPMSVFDIHGGGIDLAFPHHENEIAQTCCAFGQERMAGLWMHNGFLQVESRKMSKSLGNFTTIDDVLRDWPADVVRLTMLKTHYRRPIDWTLRSLDDSARTLAAWSERAGAGASAGEPSPGLLAALGDDLNTPAGIAYLHRVAGDGGDPGVPLPLAADLGLLGIDLARACEAAAAAAPPRRGLDEDARALINERLDARRRRDFAAADRIRDELSALGVALKDGKDEKGEPVTTWEFVR